MRQPRLVLPRRAIWIFSCLLLCLGMLQASQIRLINVDEMAQRADRIFSGRCVGVRSVRDAELRAYVTYVTFDVDEAVKGNVGQQVTIKMPGGMDAPRGKMKLLPTFRVGEEVILFLYGESSSGFSSPVGFRQGKFTVVESKDGTRHAVNGLGNRNLFDKLPEQSRAVAARAMAGIRSEREMTPGALLEMARRLGRGAGSGASPGQGRR